MTARFPKAYIQQQPEYRYLVSKETEHVIHTCFEDGQVKLRFGHKVDPPQGNTAHIPNQRQKGGNTLSRSSVYHLTGRGYDGLHRNKSGEKEEEKAAESDDTPKEETKVLTESEAQPHEKNGSGTGELESVKVMESSANNKQNNYGGEKDKIPGTESQKDFYLGVPTISSKESVQSESADEDHTTEKSATPFTRARKYGNVQKPGPSDPEGITDNSGMIDEEHTREDSKSFFTNVVYWENPESPPVSNTPSGTPDVGASEYDGTEHKMHDGTALNGAPQVMVISDLTDVDAGDCSEDIDVVHVNAEEYLASNPFMASGRARDKDYGRFLTQVECFGDRAQKEGTGQERVLQNNDKCDIHVKSLHVKLEIPTEDMRDDDDPGEVSSRSVNAERASAPTRRVCTPADVTSQRRTGWKRHHVPILISRARSGPGSRRRSANHYHESITRRNHCITQHEQSTSQRHQKDNITSAERSRRWTVATSSGTMTGLPSISPPSRQVSWARETSDDNMMHVHGNGKGRKMSEKKASVRNIRKTSAAASGTAAKDGKDSPRKVSREREVVRRWSVLDLQKQQETPGHSSPDESPPGTRRVSSVSGPSRQSSRVTSSSHEEHTNGAEFARQASQYDPKVEKSQSYNHQFGNSFNKASQYLTPVRSGLRNLQVHYSQTNTAYNDGLIFAHLLRASHVRNAVVEEGVYALERRLYNRRHGDSPHATTFYDIRDEWKIRRPKRSSSKTAYRTVAKKKNDRRERIKKKNDELETGYTPRALSLTPLAPEDMDKLLEQCRHLRVDPRRQQHLYRTDSDYWDSVMSEGGDEGTHTITTATSAPRSTTAERV